MFQAEDAEVKACRLTPFHEVRLVILGQFNELGGRRIAWSIT